MKINSSRILGAKGREKVKTKDFRLKARANGKKAKGNGRPHSWVQNLLSLKESDVSSHGP